MVPVVFNTGQILLGLAAGARRPGLLHLAVRADRVLVDRLWPRGVRKADAALDETAKELTPSTELRQAFHHGELDFDTFAARYRAELDDSDASSRRSAARYAPYMVATPNQRNGSGSHFLA